MSTLGGALLEVVGDRFESALHMHEFKKDSHFGFIKGLGVVDRVVVNPLDSFANVFDVPSAHSSSPVRSGADAATSDGLAMTVQEGVDIPSPGVGVVGCRHCAAPADSSPKKEKPAAGTAGRDTRNEETNVN